MKKYFIILTFLSLACLLMLTSCVFSEAGVDIDIVETNEESQINRAEPGSIQGSVIVYRDVEHLIRTTIEGIGSFDGFSALIIRAEVLDEREQYRYDERHGIYIPLVTNRVRVIEIFYGDVEVGSIIDVNQLAESRRSGILTAVFTPAIGDDLILFLALTETGAGPISPDQGVFRVPDSLTNEMLMGSNGAAAAFNDYVLETANPNNPFADLPLTIGYLIRVAEGELPVPRYALSFEVFGGEPRFLTIYIPEGVAILDRLINNPFSSFSADGPTKEGYTFEGWYMDSAFTIRITEATLMPAADITMYARWTAHDTPTPQPTHVVIENLSGNNGWLSISCTSCCSAAQLSATVYPLDANQNVVWCSPDRHLLSLDQTGLVSVSLCCCSSCCCDIPSMILITATAENGVVGTFYVGVLNWHTLDEDEDYSVD